MHFQAFAGTLAVSLASWRLVGFALRTIAPERGQSRLIALNKFW
jgi:hypothetical protein